VSLFSNVNPVNLNSLFFIMRFNEVSGNVYVSRNTNSSNRRMISGLNSFVLSRKGSSNISGWLNFYYFSVVNNMRFNEISIVNLISFNVYSSSNFSVFLFSCFNDSISLYKFVFSFDENRIKGFSNSVYIRLYDDLLSGWFNKSISDVSSWS